MKFITYIIGLITISVSAISFGADSHVDNRNSAINFSTNSPTKSRDVKWQEMVSTGESLIQNNQPKEAIEKCLDPVIEQFNSLSSTNAAQIYCARDSAESFAYLIQAAALSDKKSSKDGKDVPEYWGNQFADKKNNTEVLSQFWAEAFYLKGYALIEIGHIDKAKKTVIKAVGLSPLNFKYLAELGHIYQLEKNWDMSLEAFKAAEEAVPFSHPDIQDVSRARAWRGFGFVYIEQGKFKEAEEMYKKCLKLNPNDQTALSELEYIHKLRNK